MKCDHEALKTCFVAFLRGTKFIGVQSHQLLLANCLECGSTLSYEIESLVDELVKERLLDMKQEVT